MEMRKIVDSNFLQSSRLADYLGRSKTHFAVLTDYAAMEAYKGNTLSSIHRSMEILSAYPSQVIILKNTLLVCGLRPRTSHLQRRMIDREQTAGFDQYCSHLKEAANGNKMIQDQLLAMGREADEHMERMLRDAEKMGETLGSVAKTFTDEELKILRKRLPYPKTMLEKISNQAMVIAAILFRDHPRLARLPNAQQLPSTYIFRFSLGAVFLALKKIETGADATLSPAKFRNDLVDLSFATYWTFFDGILTEDKNLKELYVTMTIVLRLAFSVAA
jgi:hypothetical protein